VIQNLSDRLVGTFQSPPSAIRCGRDWSAQTAFKQKLGKRAQNARKLGRGQKTHVLRENVVATFGEALSKIDTPENTLLGFRALERVSVDSEASKVSHFTS
jgi:hypothetical protein